MKCPRMIKAAINDDAILKEIGNTYYDGLIDPTVGRTHIQEWSRGKNIPSDNVIPLYDDGGGNIIARHKNDNKIYFYDHEEGMMNPRVIAESLKDYKIEQDQWREKEDKWDKKFQKKQTIKNKERKVNRDLLKKKQRTTFLKGTGIGAGLGLTTSVYPTIKGWKSTGLRPSIAGLAIGTLGGMLGGGIMSQNKTAMNCPRMIVKASEISTKPLPRINIPKIKSPKGISTPSIKNKTTSLGTNKIKSMKSVIPLPRINSKSIFNKDKLDI